MGLFNDKIHYSTSKLSYWFCDDAYRYRVYILEDVLKPDLIEQYQDIPPEHLQPVIDDKDTKSMLNEFIRLRITDETIYLRNSLINRINGIINITFSCGGSHYIDQQTFFQKLETFRTPDKCEQTQSSQAGP